MIELAGQKAEAVPVADGEPLDASWAEPAAFDAVDAEALERLMARVFAA